MWFPLLPILLAQYGQYGFPPIILHPRLFACSLVMVIHPINQTKENQGKRRTQNVVGPRRVATTFGVTNGIDNADEHIYDIFCIALCYKNIVRLSYLRNYHNMGIDEDFYRLISSNN